MSLRRPRSDAPLPYSIDLEPLRETLTAYGGFPQVAEAFRALGGAAAAELGGTVQVEAGLRFKERHRGFSEVDLVERFVPLLAAGGECLDDVARLGADQGLVALVGHALPSPGTARKFLYQPHDGAQADRAPARAPPAAASR